MKNINLKFDSKPKFIENLVNNGHEEYEKSNGIKDDYKEFYITITDDDSVVGVLSAYIVFAEIYIDDLWVKKSTEEKGTEPNCWITYILNMRIKDLII